MVTRLVRRVATDRATRHHLTREVIVAKARGGTLGQLATLTGTTAVHRPLWGHLGVGFGDLLHPCEALHELVLCHPVLKVPAAPPASPPFSVIKARHFL